MPCVAARMRRPHGAGKTPVSRLPDAGRCAKCRAAAIRISTRGAPEGVGGARFPLSLQAVSKRAKKGRWTMNKDNPDTFVMEDQSEWEATQVDDVFLPSVQVQLGWKDVEAAVARGAVVPAQAHALWASCAGQPAAARRRNPGTRLRIDTDRGALGRRHAQDRAVWRRSDDAGGVADGGCGGGRWCDVFPGPLSPHPSLGLTPAPGRRVLALALQVFLHLPLKLFPRFAQTLDVVVAVAFVADGARGPHRVV